MKDVVKYGGIMFGVGLALGVANYIFSEKLIGELKEINDANEHKPNKADEA